MATVGGRSAAKPRSARAAEPLIHRGSPRLRIERVFNAPRELVWRAWTERKHLMRWWGPDGFTCPVAEIDARIGGRFRTCMTSPDGVEHWVGGIYLEVVPPERLVFTWAWESDGKPSHISTVKIELFAQGRSKTRLVLNHSGFESATARDSHRWGWTSSFDSLAKSLA